MSASPAAPTRLRRTAAAIIAGGLVAGTLDAMLAFALYGWGMPLGIASGLLGRDALRGGAGTWILGMALHFAIALGAAAFYGVASWKLEFLRVHVIVCGLFYGVGVYLVMNLVVVPLSAFPFAVGPFTVAMLIKGLLGHMLVIGLPISFTLRQCLR